MLNNPELKITDIKPSIPRFNLAWGRLKLQLTGDLVHYCDSRQEVELWVKLYSVASKRVELLQEQRTRLLEEQASSLAHKRKLDIVVPLLLLATAIVSSGLTYLVILDYYN